MCIPTELPEIAACNAAVALANDPAVGATFSCIAGGTVPGCLRMLQDGVASLAKVPASGIYEADQAFGGKPIVSEFYSEALGKYTEGYAIAAVNPDWCYATAGGKPTLADLESTNACFSGYGTDGGWNVAVGSLYNDAEMATVSNSTTYTVDTQTVQKYFKDVS